MRLGAISLAVAVLAAWGGTAAAQSPVVVVPASSPPVVAVPAYQPGVTIATPGIGVTIGGVVPPPRVVVAPFPVVRPVYYPWYPRPVYYPYHHHHW